MQEIQYTENAHQPVESFQVVMIEVATREPWLVLGFTSDIVNYGHNDRAEVVPESQRGPGKRRSQRSHACGCLGKEKLQQPGQGEKIGRPKEQILKSNPKESNG